MWTDQTDADAVLEWGLIDRVVPEGDHVEAATDLAGTIASRSPVAVQTGEEAFHEMAGLDYSDCCNCVPVRPHDSVRSIRH